MNTRDHLENTWTKFTRLSPFKKAFIICILSFLVIYLRRPELIQHPQFWAEDFAVFYRDAYMRGFGSLTHSYSDLLQTFQRLVALVVIKFPLDYGPILFNLASMAVMTLPIFVLWSDKSILKKEGDFKKLILTALLLLIPNVTEIFGNLTNCIWYLAIAAILVLVRSDPASIKRWLIFDSILLVLLGLTGPFSGVLLIAALFLIAHKGARLPANYIKLAIILMCACVQIAVYSHSARQSSSVIHQAGSIAHSYNRPIEITGMRFFAMPVLGKELVNDRDIAASPQVYALGVVFMILSVLAFVKSRLEVRTILIFCMVLYVISFFRAQTVPITQFWQMLQFNAFGDRYFLIPFFGLFVALLALTNHGKAYSAKIATSILALYIVFFPFSFAVPALKDFNFPPQAKKFQSLPRGSEGCFTINPDAAWTTCLKKK